MSEDNGTENRMMFSDSVEDDNIERDPDRDHDEQRQQKLDDQSDGLNETLKDIADINDLAAPVSMKPTPYRTVESFDDFLSRAGFDFVDTAGKVELARLAFSAGLVSGLRMAQDLIKETNQPVQGE